MSDERNDALANDDVFGGGAAGGNDPFGWDVFHPLAPPTPWEPGEEGDRGGALEPGAALPGEPWDEDDPGEEHHVVDL